MKLKYILFISSFLLTQTVYAHSWTQLLGRLEDPDNNATVYIDEDSLINNGSKHLVYLRTEYSQLKRIWLSKVSAFDELVDFDCDPPNSFNRLKVINYLDEDQKPFAINPKQISTSSAEEPAIAEALEYACGRKLLVNLAGSRAYREAALKKQTVAAQVINQPEVGGYDPHSNQVAIKTESQSAALHITSINNSQLETKAIEQKMIDAFPDWRNTVKSKSFNDWLLKQPAATNKLSSSNDPADAILLLTMYTTVMKANIPVTFSQQTTTTKHAEAGGYSPPGWNPPEKGGYDPNNNQVVTNTQLNSAITTKGTYKFNDANYTGELVNGFPTGYGVVSFNTGVKYEGIVTNGRLNGKGVMTWPNGDKYEGDFANGERTGNGTYYGSNGNRYSGGYIKGVSSGNGIFYYSDGGTISGRFYEGLPTTGSTLKFPNGNWFKGQFAKFDIYQGEIHNASGQIIGRAANGKVSYFQNQQPKAQQAPSDPSLVEVINGLAKIANGFLDARRASDNAALHRGTEDSVQSNLNPQSQKRNDYPYVSTSGNKYKYDLSTQQGRTAYQSDMAAQVDDSISPQVKMDHTMGQQGGGIE